MHYEVINEDDLKRTVLEDYYSRSLVTVSDPNQKNAIRQLSLLPVDDALGTDHLQVKLW